MLVVAFACVCRFLEAYHLELLADQLGAELAALARRLRGARANTLLALEREVLVAVAWRVEATQGHAATGAQVVTSLDFLSALLAVCPASEEASAGGTLRDTLRIA